MQEFLVEITVTVPAGTPAVEFDQRRAAEFARARELADRGLLR